MKRYRFEKMNFDDMKIENIHSLVKSTIDLIAKSTRVFGEMGKSVVSMMIRDHEKFISEVNYQSKNIYSEEMIIEDMNWDKRLKEVKQVIESAIKSDDEKIKIAAHNLDFFLTKYSSLNCSILYPHKYLRVEMFYKYQQDSELKKSAKIIGVDKLFIELEFINTSFNSLHDLRIEDNDARINELVKNERTQMVNSYSLFCTYMEETASLSSNAELHSIFDMLDELRKKCLKMGRKEEKVVSA